MDEYMANVMMSAIIMGSGIIITGMIIWAILHEYTKNRKDS